MNRRTSIGFVFGFSIALLSIASTHSQEISFAEDYALASDREAELKKLVPGTEQYYYFHCIHYQNTEQLDKVDPMLKLWIERFGETQLVRQIQNRQALLNYSTNPQATLEYLRRHLGLHFGHQREIPSAEPGLPTSLDANLINYERLFRDALTNHKNTDGLESSVLHRVAGKATDLEKLDPQQRRHLLERLRWPDVPNLPQMIVADLQYKNSQGFGAFTIHRNLTLDQLNELLRLRPRLRNETNFVNTYLAKLVPGNDAALRDDEESIAYLDRLWQYASELDAVHNSLKANILFRRLKIDQRMGVYDKDRFVEYLKLPRQVSYINPALIERLTSSNHIVNLNADYRQIARLMPIVNDELLVRDYLHHFLVDQNDFKEFLPWIRDTYLRRQFATVKILNGLGDSEQWASMLSPDEFQRLMDRVDLDFAHTNPTEFSVDQAVELELFIKNVDKLIVKVFEINTANFYRTHKREIDTDINLDGLVPNWQESFQYESPPLQRVSRKFSFDQIDKRGVYVIDFIGNGKSSRALIRKGRLYPVVETTIAGQRFTILNESREIVRDASLWVADREFEPSENGSITIPFSTQATSEVAVIQQGDFSSLAKFNHIGETYQFNAGIYVDRESLLRGGKATVLLRPQLKLAGLPAPLELLSEVKLGINSMDLDGVGASKEIPNLEISSDGEISYEFQVPPRLSQITFTLTVKVHSVSRGEDQYLSASQTFTVNQVDSGDIVDDLHLSRTPDGYVLEARGKSGEARPSQAVLLILKHQSFTRPVTVSLQTDAEGAISLGSLDGIVNLSARLRHGSDRNWHLVADNQSGYQNVHAIAGNPISIPLDVAAGDVQRTEFALMEIRGSSMVTDYFDSIEKLNGLVQIKPLPPGDYRLLLRERNKSINIRVTDGDDQQRFALSPARMLEMRGRDPMHVESIEAGEDQVTVQLGGDLEQARVHVYATRYMPRFNAFSLLGAIRDAEPLIISQGSSPSAYVAGRAIGEEYQYILDRQYAEKFPGVMLTRPTLLLNPWAIRTTENTVQTAADGDDFFGAGGNVDSKAERADNQDKQQASNLDAANLDFLASGTSTLLGLTPNENGVVEFDRESLGDKHMLQIVIEGPTETIVRQVILPDSSLVFRDLRLANALDPENHFAQRKQFDVLKKDAAFELTDTLSSKFQHYDDLGDIYRYYMTLTGDGTLAEFSFVTRWPSLSPEEKRELYKQYACHELHFFLMNKDPEFFDTIVKPYLENKLSKTFMDLWLTDQRVDRFVKPWEYKRLNTVEQILLGQRISDRRAQLQQFIDDAYELNPTTRQQFDQWYSYLVMGSALDVDGISTDFLQIQDETIRHVESLSEFQAHSAENMRRMSRNAPARSGRAAPSAPSLGRGVGLDDAARPSPKPGDVAADIADMPDADADALSGEKDPNARYDIPTEETEMFNKNLGERESGFSAGLKYSQADEKLRKSLRQYYQRLKPTQEWVENNYYRLPIEQQNRSLVDANRYWRDYAHHAGEEPFLSPYFTEATGNFTEMMLALAVMDLPFEAPEHEFDFVDDQMRLTPKGDMIAFYQEVRPAIFDRRGSAVLVSENFFRKDDRYRTENGKQYDKFVRDEFLTHVVYGGQVVITNPTSTPQDIDLLVQIPAGAISTSGSQETRTIQMDLAAFSSSKMEYYFYFPSTGDFQHYPAHVSDDELVTAVADPLLFRVVAEPSDIDTTSWAYVSQNGSPDQVLEYLRKENLQNIDLSKIAFRMKEAPYFERVIEILSDRFAYNHTLWSYAVKHNQPEIIADFLKHSDQFLAQCGKALSCELLQLDSVDRRWYEHREFWPLVNARSHRLGSRQTILNDRIWTQYHQLMEILSQQAKLSNDDHLAITYYMFLQDRIDEALHHFDQVDANQLDTKVQYDYCAAYASLYREDVDQAATIAKRYEQFPVNRWRDLFASVLETVSEIKGESVSTETELDAQTKLAATTPSFDFEVESRKTKIRYQNLSSVNINYYQMDIELLFSRNPFVQKQEGSFAMIRPNQTESVELPADQDEFSIDLPDELSNSNVLVEITAEGETKSQAYYAHSLNTQIIEQYGHLHVTHADSKEALAEVYVKVYARKADGSVHFYKDGYTDLRGRFDYASLSNQTLDDVQQFSMLVMSPQYGAVVKQADVPKE